LGAGIHKLKLRGHIGGESGMADKGTKKERKTGKKKKNSRIFGSRIPLHSGEGPYLEDQRSAMPGGASGAEEGGVLNEEN